MQAQQQFRKASTAFCPAEGPQPADVPGKGRGRGQGRGRGRSKKRPRENHEGSESEDNDLDKEDEEIEKELSDQEKDGLKRTPSKKEKGSGDCLKTPSKRPAKKTPKKSL